MHVRGGFEILDGPDDPKDIINLATFLHHRVQLHELRRLARSIGFWEHLITVLPSEPPSAPGGLPATKIEWSFRSFVVVSNPFQVVSSM